MLVVRLAASLIIIPSLGDIVLKSYTLLFLKSYTPFFLESYTLLLDAIVFMEIEIEIIETDLI
jgi:hypothetical protein